MNRGNVVLNYPERFEKKFVISNEKLDKAIEHATTKLKLKMKNYGLKYVSHFPEDPVGRKYKLVDNSEWTHGMHTGCYLISYLLTGDEDFLDVASKQMIDFKYRLDAKYQLSDHDVGFTYSPSCVAYYKITGDEFAKNTALKAAEHLYNVSYSQKGGFIVRRLCSQHEDPAWCRTMMDTLLNIPLFYWAHEMTGDKKFLDAANSQVDITEKYLIREDGSSYHHYQFDVETHKPLYGVTFQGHRNESTWSRGHSWGVLGIPLAYSYTKNKDLLALQRDISFFMLNHLPEDCVPYWDYDFTQGDEPRDSSAGAIAACGLLETSKHLDECDPEKQIYINAANMIINGIIDNCTNDIGEDYDGILHSVAGAVPFNLYVRGSAPYGDIFYLDALKRLKDPEWKCMW